MKTLALIFSLIFVTAVAKAPETVYTFNLKTLDNADFSLAKYKGKKILIVNTASKCGYTPQYDGLQKLYEEHKDKLVIIGFPSDNFGGQEYKDNDSISAFCKKNFGVTFPLTTRVDVKGPNATPVFKYLCDKNENGVLDAQISWNFNKFIIDENGKLLQHFDSKVTPESPELLKYIDQ